jgi:hypothetical protein
MNDRGDDGYTARVIGRRAAVAINNVIARLRPTKVFLAGMNQTHKTYTDLPASMCIEVDGVEDVLACRPSSVVEGLLISKHMNWRLRIDEKARTLAGGYKGHNGGLVVTENAGIPNQVAAINYACSIVANVVLGPTFDRDELHLVQQLIYESKKIELGFRSHPL